ncbi:amidohydrolase family protein [Tenggerimyces flavus]|uniref:Amidohydrolase family protein n=1 Tax=Tenggerimyces flavus TaxID=1708749 RepID=A0ABV7Y6K0_9ACTN|nr:amidohydrolase family protein [Tenggerimyces flavus]MBM7791127.1 cytosine/adenosine deaminase-related metal-dependent hydrolase [Tenggerimyces flavus]
MTSLLLKNGLLVDPAEDPTRPRRADLLVDGTRIAEIGPDLAVGSDVTVIDATHRIVLPGFVDTHRHTWQAAIRMIDPDDTLGGYLQRILNTIAPNYRPQDIHAATLAGAVEALDSGITTLVDWSHLQLTPEHTDAAIDALRASGIRAQFGYGSPSLAGPDAASTPMPTDIRRVHATLDDPLVTLIIAARGPGFSSPEVARAEWQLARELGVPISVHAHGDDLIDFLRDEDLLGPDILYAHANQFTDKALQTVADSGGGLSIAPIVEAQMGHGQPITGRALAAGVNTGLAVDAMTSTSTDMFSVMRVAYSLERAKTSITSAQILRMATTGGAEAAGLADRVGALRPGMQADLMVLRTDTLSMAPLHDPVAAIVMNADRSAVDTVLVAGRIVKQAGAIAHHNVTEIVERVTESGTYLAKSIGTPR